MKLPATVSNKSGRRGATLVEAGIVISAVLLILFGIFEYARFLMIQEVGHNAVREGAREACIHTDNKTTAEIQDHVFKYLANQAASLQVWDSTTSSYRAFNKTTDIQVFKASASTGQALDSSDNVVTDWTQAPFTNAKFGEGIAVRINCTFKAVLPTFVFQGNLFAVNCQSIMRSEAN
jgi:Flp pilus assembly protein TadG